MLKRNIEGSIKFFDYRCKLKHQLTRHLQIHDDPDDRKHKCEICGKGFIATQKLREHILTHTNIKPYKCELCNQAFSNFSGHRQHMMKKVRKTSLKTNLIFENKLILRNLKPIF
jgi:uncharacterized Zn-finger protein